MSNAELITPQSYSINFPKKQFNEIERDNFIKAINQQLNNLDVIFITGEEEIGKTTVLSQFARFYSENTISVFLKPINKFSSSIENIILDLTSQIHWILNKQEQQQDLNYNYQLLTQYFNKLNRVAKGRRFYFILDGFEHIDQNDIYIYKEFFQQLPLGYPAFKFLISDRDNFIYDNFLKDIINKGKLKFVEYPWISFSLEELTKYCNNLNLSKEQLHEIYKITGSVPGKVKSIFDKLQGGTTFEDLFAEASNFEDILFSQWSDLNLSSKLELVLALLAFEDSEYTIETLSEIFNQEKTELKINLEHLQVFEISESEVVRFKSNLFKSYTKTKLASLKTQIEELVIDHLLRTQTNIDSIIELPKRYKKNEKYDEILKILDEQHFLKILDKKGSFNFLEDQTNLGIIAAKELKKYNDFYRLSLQKSCLAEIKHTFILEAEIEAKINFTDFDTARKLADASLIKEDRFRLLVFLAKKKKEKNLTVEEDLLSSIKTLYNQIDPSKFYDEDEIIEIATNLLYTFPEYGIEFLEKSNGSQSSTSDLGFAKLAILLKKLRTAEDSTEDLKKINSRINNPIIKSIANAFNFLYGNGDVEEFIQQIKSIESSSEQLQLLRQFIAENYKSDGVEKTIELAIDILIKNSDENATTASILEDISTPLPYLDYEKAKHLIEKLESFKAISKERGPTLSHFKFLTNIACFEIKNDLEKSSFKFTEIFFDIDEIKDVGIKTECLAILYSSILTFDKPGQLEKKDGLESLVVKNLDNYFPVLLNESADHYRITKGILKEVAKVNPLKSLTFCDKLNSFERRDKAFLATFKAYIKHTNGNLDFNCIDSVYRKIIDPQIKNSATIGLLEKIKDYENDFLGTIINNVETYITRIDDFHSNRLKFYGYSISIELIYRLNKNHPLVQTIPEKIENLLNTLDNKFDFISSSFQMSTTLIPINFDLAKKIHNNAESQKESMVFNSPISLRLYHNTLRLAINSLEGILESDSDLETKLNKIIDYIKVQPSTLWQIKHFVAILNMLDKAKQNDLFNKIFLQNIKPLINILLSSQCTFSKEERLIITENIITSTYLFNTELCFMLINSNSPVYADSCYADLCDFFLDRNAMGVVINEEDETQLKVDFEHALIALNILKKVNTDALISHKIRKLLYCAKNNSFTRENINYLSPIIKEIIDNQLPDGKNIAHDGYKILTTAYYFRIIKNRSTDDWQNLIMKAQNIPNQSDRGYALCAIADVLPDGIPKLNKSDIIDLSLKNIEEIKSYVGRVERYGDIIQMLKRINPLSLKEKLKKAIFDSVKENNFDLYQSQKSIIDFAHEYDPSFADELMKIIDSDPARKPISNSLKKHIDKLKLQQSFFDGKISEEGREIEILANVCATAAQKLDSERIAPKSIEQVYKILDDAHKRPISETYSIFSFFIQNANKKYNDTNEQRKAYLYPLFDSNLKAVQMIKVLSSKSKNTNVYFVNNESQNENGSHLIVKPGDREIAISFIKKWVKVNGIDYIKICDPYFTIDDLELIKEMFLINPELKFTVLSECDDLGDSETNMRYQEKWDEICDQEPPEIKIIQVGFQKNTNNVKLFSPNHDRWYISHQGGLRVGTSYNSLGIGKNSEISIMTIDEAKRVENQIMDKYIQKRERYHEGKRLYYTEIII